MTERVCPGCGTDLTGTHGKRKWCSDTCRKNTAYGGICSGCGAPTNGSNGPGKAPAYCLRCVGIEWSRERIIEKIKEWAFLYGSAPSAAAWNPGVAKYQGSPRTDEIRTRYDAGDWPSTTTVRTYFGSWNAAIAAAGFAVRGAVER